MAADRPIVSADSNRLQRVQRFLLGLVNRDAATAAAEYQRPRPSTYRDAPPWLVPSEETTKSSRTSSESSRCLRAQRRSSGPIGWWGQTSSRPSLKLISNRV